MPDRLAVRRLSLQIARDLAERTCLATLLAAAESVLVNHRHELRVVRARIKRREAKANT